MKFGKFGDSRLRWERLMITTILIALPAALFVDCSSRSGSSVDMGAYVKEIEQWQSKRLTRLKAEDGWLTLCGLYWLHEGENSFGTDSANRVIFPQGKSPLVAGSLWVSGEKVHMAARPGVEMKFRDSVVSQLDMISDEEGAADPTILTLGTLRFYLIKRAGKLGVRVKDSDNPARVNFRGLEYFPTDQRWRFEARFEPYVPPKMMKIATMINTVEDDSCPGALVFTRDGKDYRLDAVVEKGSDGQFFLMFSDETAGKETYAVGRQLYAPLPDKDNKVILDFNKAYNWPCVFTEFATCPIPPRQNHLPFRVEAGEKMYSGH